MAQYETVLVIDDEVEIVNLIEIVLKNEGFNVLKAYDGEEGLELLSSEQVHLVILDIMMPKMDGITLIKKLRDFLHMPVIFLSAKSQDMDKILGLTLGADDYMTKPFNPMELAARVKSQLRRYIRMQNLNAMQDIEKLSIKELMIDKKSHKVYLYEKEICLTPTEYKILLLLAENTGRIYSAEEIFEAVWGEKSFEVNNTVMVHIWRLREKIEINPKDPKLIETVWGVGYKMEK